MKKLIIPFVALFVILILYGFFVNPKNFKMVEKRVKIDNLVDSFDGFKIVQFSDLLLGSTKSVNDLDKIVTAINESKPDIIVFTGDLFSNDYKLNDEEIAKTKDYLKKLDCSLYKYSVIGDNDNKQIEIYKDIMKESNFRVLDNESTYLFYKDNMPIKITGLTNINDLSKSLEIEDNLETTMNLVLTHYPDYLDYLLDININLILTGHSLNGQIKIPFVGGIMHKDLADNYLDSYYNINNTQMFVSGGLGTETIQFRLFNKPEINLYRLEK